MNLEISEKLRYYEYKAFKEQLFVDADKEVFESYYPEMNNEFQKPCALSSCPKFTCNASMIDGACINKIENTGVISYEINTCPSDSSCLLNFSDLFDENKDNKAYYCSKFEYIENNYKTIIRLPGEPCKYNDQCSTNTCQNYFCAGKDAACIENKDCMAGNYCLKGLCKKQVFLGESCNSQYECRNNMACYKNKCIYYYSLAIGEYIDFNDKSIKDMKDKSELCLFSYIDPNTNECSKLEIQGQIDSKLQECKSGDSCVYKNHKGRLVNRNCVCGYNKHGKGYCPFSHDNEKDWYDYFYQIRINRNNNCHTLNRNNCPFIPKKFITYLKQLKRDTKLAAYVYGSEECIIKEFFQWTLTSIWLKISLFSSFIILLI